MSKASRRARRQERRGPQSESPSQRLGDSLRLAPPGLVDVVMPVYGEWALAERALLAVPAALGKVPKEDVRFILIDNGTPDWQPADGGPMLKATEQSKAVRDLMGPNDLFDRLEENVGYPGGVTAAVQRGSSALILVLTADVFLHPGAVDAMVRELDDPQVGVVGCKLIFPSDMASPHGPPGKVQHAGISFDIRGRPKHHYIGWSADHPKVNRRMVLAAVTGACMMFRRSLWNHVGGFDLQYGTGTFEDIDFCFAARAANSQVVYCPQAVGDHLVSGARLQGAGQGFNLALNSTVFKGKYAKMLAWDEWRFY